MNVTQFKKPDWANFIHTATVKFGDLIAGIEHQQAAAGLSERTFSFVLAAAASSEQIGLPGDGDEVMDTGGLVAMLVDHQAGQLLVRFEASGLPAVELLANRWVGLNSADGHLALDLRFDEIGQAVVQLADDTANRQALTRFELILPPASFTFQPDGEGSQ